MTVLSVINIMTMGIDTLLHLIQSHYIVTAPTHAALDIK